MKKLIILLIIALNVYGLKGSHIIGGDFYVTHLNNNDFLVTLLLFRNCNGNADFDTELTITVYEEGTNILQPGLSFQMPLDSVLDVALGNECFVPTICVEQGYYNFVMTIPDNPNGYYFVWERCCRNAGISNIQNSGDAGMVFLVTIPDPSIQNSTPIFQEYPNDAFFCLTGSNNIDFSATDPDGDSLVYILETPLAGVESGTGNPNPMFGGPKPHAPILWQAPYSLANIIGGVDPMTINPVTGLITAAPDMAGLFVFAVKVEEYRNGVKIGEIRREIQFEAIACAVDAPPVFVNFDPIDTIFVLPYQINSIPISVSDNVDDEIQMTASSPLFNPLIYDPYAIFDSTQTATGELTISFVWDNLPCSFVSDSAYWIHFEAFSIGCSGVPQISTMDLAIMVILPENLPTSFISPPQVWTIDYGDFSAYQFDVQAVDPNYIDTMLLNVISDLNFGVNSSTFDGDSANFSVLSPFFWEPTCDDIRPEPYLVEFEVITRSCTFVDTLRYPVEIFLQFPTDYPTEFTDPSPQQTFVVNDSLYCFNVIAEDLNNIDTLFLSIDTNSELFMSTKREPNFSDTSGVFNVTSEFCWLPTCDEVRNNPYIQRFQVITKNCAILDTTYLDVAINVITISDGSIQKIPNVFTPNNDSQRLNEYFELEHTPDVCRNDFDLRIYNRWGVELFNTPNIGAQWSGVDQAADDVGEGEYFYIINYTYLGNPVWYKGTITLLR